MENHKNRPTGSMAPHEANAMSFKKNKNKNKGKGAQKPQPNAPPKAQNNPNTFKKNKKKGKKPSSEVAYGEQDQDCYRCGLHGHWSKICRTPKHIVDMYQELKKKLEKHETNYVEGKQLETGPSNNLEFDNDLMDVEEEDVHGDLE